jgi:hypothetical protein
MNNGGDLVMTIEVEDPARGTLSVTHTTSISDLNTYNGPLGRITIHSIVSPDAQFVAPANDFIVLLAQFIQQFRGI